MNDAPSQAEQRYSQPLAKARHARGEFISLTHDLPEPATQEILRLWVEADTAMLAFIRELERGDAL